MLRPSLLALVLALPAAARAQDVQVVLPEGASDRLRGVLEGESLSLSLEEQGLTAAQDYVAAARADYRRLLAALYSEGFYGGVISIRVDGREAASIEPLEAPARIGTVVLDVQPGPRFTFGTAALGPLPPGATLPPDFAPGRIARSTVIQQAAADAVTAWRAAGNAKAAVGSQEITAVHPGDRLDVRVGIVPGPRLSFGPVTVSGNEAVRTARVLRIAGIPSGRVFDPAVLERAAARLRRTGTFDSVAVVESDAVGPGDTLPIELQVVESLPRRIGFGAEISSLEGLSLNAFWLHRNLLGGAERLRVEGAVSDIESQAGAGGGGLDYSLGATFGRPATFAPDNDLTFAVRLSQQDEEDYFLRQAETSVGITRYATDDLTLSFALGLLVAEEETAIETRDYTLLTLPLTAVWDRRDDPQNPRAGFFLNAEVTPFVSLAGEAGNGARLYADARLYRTFGERVTLAARGQLGSVLGAGRTTAPQDFLFFAGGGGSVRGLPFQSLGVPVTIPRIFPPQEATLGGASLAGLQLEARVDLNARFTAVAFADAAIVGEDSFPGSGDEWGAGIGLGARYNSFVGPIRADIAVPATGDDAFGAVQLYIGIGQAF